MDTSSDTMKQAATDALRQLSDAERKQVATDLGFRPGRAMTDWLWLIVVVAFALVLVGSCVTLAISVFTSGTSPQLILTLFTSVVGFLAGLFAPSPITDKTQK